MLRNSVVWFYVDGYRIPVIRYHEVVKQRTDWNGRPSSAPQGGIYRIIVRDIARWTNLLDAWAIHPTMMKECRLEELSFDGGKLKKTLEFLDTFCIHLQYIDKGDDEPFYVLVISAATIIRNGAVVISKKWRKTDPALRNRPVTHEVEEPEQDTKVFIDIYIDSQTGHRFKEITPNTENYRIIHYMDYNDILEEYSDKINSKEVIDELKLMSQEVIIDNEKIQMIIQKVDTNSRLSEFQMYIVLERNWIDPLNAPATITAEEDHHTILHEDGEIKMNIDALLGKNGNVYYKSPKGNVVIAQVHGHNKVQKNNKINLEGTSKQDQITAKFNRFNIYAIESYKNETGKQAVIAKTDGAGKETLNFALTIGHKIKGGNAGTGKGTVNIGKDAIDFYSKNPRKK